MADRPVPLPPQNLDAEEYVLGAMMLSVHAIEAVAEILTPRDFYRGSHGVIYETCLALYTTGGVVDAVTVADHLEGRGELDGMGGKTRIHEIATLVPATSNVAHHARIVREHSIHRDLIIFGELVQRLGWDRQIGGQPASGVELVGEAERLLLELAQTRQSHDDFVPTSTAASEMLERLTELHARGADIVGLPTGYREIDKLTLGFEPGNLIVVAARPSIGKTAWVLGAVAHAILHLDSPVPTAFLTLEMSRWEVMQRLVSMEASIDLAHLRTGQLGTDQWGDAIHALGKIAAAPLFIEDSGSLSLTELRSKVRRLKLRNPKLGLVVVDYIQLMSSGARFESRAQEVSQISRGLKMLAGELQLPIIALSQLSREVERRHDKRPMLSDLRESGGIEADADLVIMLYRDEYYFPEDVENAGLAEVNIGKQRNGPTGMRKMTFVKRYAKFADTAEPQL